MIERSKPGRLLVFLFTNLGRRLGVLSNMATGIAIMVQGCTSDAGKSLITMALCRHLSNLGFKVAPFKAQNMSNNARVVADGEIGTAQWLQAKAARVKPDVRMNPVLLKPESDVKSQVVVLGKANLEYSQMGWRFRSNLLWDVVSDSLKALLEEFEIVVIEGAGSPAEINLSDSDIVNMRVAESVDARVLLVVDIDRGGAFAHLFGTYTLLPENQQSLIHGFLLNKFRGDPKLLEPGPQMLTSLTKVELAGVVPYIKHSVPNEEGPSAHIISSNQELKKIHIICGPYASNLDEFALLQQVTNLTWVTSVSDLSYSDLIILPGSKNSIADLDWMQQKGIDKKIKELAGQGIKILGVCGGMQILGKVIEDPLGIESGGEVTALGLLDIFTTYSNQKKVFESSIKFNHVEEPWEMLSSQDFSGYEVRFGQSRINRESNEWVSFSQAKNIFGIYLHGLFENQDFLQSFSGQLIEDLDTTFEKMTEEVIGGFNPDWLKTFIGLTPDRINHND